MRTRLSLTRLSRWFISLTACLWLAMIAPSSTAQSPARLDPTLRLLLSGEASSGATAQWGKTVALPKHAPSNPVSVLVYTTANATPRDWLPPDGRILTQLEDITSVSVPVDRLVELARSPWVRYVQADRVARPLNDLGVTDTHAPLVHAQGWRGEGIIVGIIDTGIDWSHPDFQTWQGRTRIKALLDMSDPGDRDGDDIIDGLVAGGTLYTEADINAALVDNGLALDGPGGLIPDANAEGISLPLTVASDTLIRSLAVTIRIQHPYRGDLRVSLHTPWGETVTLVEPAAHIARGDITATFDLSALAGHTAAGVWHLLVADVASTDVGRVTSWTLHINQTVRATDRYGHGTHVAGSAAGNGQASGNDVPPGIFAGVAPAADLVVVKATRNDAGFRETDQLAAMAFIQRFAEERRQPFVINLSLGTHLGAHDGTSPLEVAIDRLAAATKPGRAVVVAAGNEGGQDIHAGATLAAGATTEFAFIIPSDGGMFIADVWFSGQSRLEIGYRPANVPLGRTIAPEAAPACDRLADRSEVCLVPSGPHPLNGAYEVQAFFMVAAPGGRWLLTVHNPGPQSARVDAWAVVDGTVWTSGVERSMRVAMPGTAREAITVGAYTTRTGWTGLDGEVYGTGAQVGGLAPFSSDGPTRDQRFKPEITAPGQAIVSSMSRWSNTDPGHIALDGWHSVNMGTSMAAPYVSGAAALLLQVDPTLTAQAVREALIAGARRDGRTGAWPSSRWGAGKLDILAAVDYLRRPLPHKIFLPWLNRHRLSAAD